MLNKREIIIDIFDELIHTFDFLTKQFDFELVHKEKNKKYIGEYLVIYRNKSSGVQLEFSADRNWFHCEIRKLINGQPAKYSDKINSFGWESLAILESDYKYDRFEYVVAGNGLTTVLNSTAALLKRHKKLLTTDSWIDTEKVERLRNEEFFKKFGIRPSANKDLLSYFQALCKQASDFLIDKSFVLIFDSKEQPPYSYNSRTEAVIFKKENIVLKISQEDWRDAYDMYYIAVNDQKQYEIDLSESNNTIYQVEITMKKLKEMEHRNWQQGS